MSIDLKEKSNLSNIENSANIALDSTLAEKIRISAR